MGFELEEVWGGGGHAEGEGGRTIRICRVDSNGALVRSNCPAREGWLIKSVGIVYRIYILYIFYIDRERVKRGEISPGQTALPFPAPGSLT